MGRLNEAFKQINRTHFLRDTEKEMSGLDAPLPIGFSQTNSQPSTVFRMLEWLDPQAGDKALDVGSGSGWTTALLAFLVKPGGKVYAVEKIPELVTFGRDNCKSLGIKNISFFESSGRYGLPTFAPYNKILVSAETDNIPEELCDQLKVKGRMVIPVNGNIMIVNKLDSENYEIKRHPGYIFVPLVK